MSCMQPLTDWRGWIIVVVMVTLGRVVVIVVVGRLIGVVVFLLAEEVGMKVSANKSRLLMTKCRVKTGPVTITHFTGG